MIEIDDVIALSDGAAHLAGASVELPGPRSEQGGWWIPLSGWIVGRREPVERVDVVHQQLQVASAPVALQRVDVGRAFPAIPHAATPGFTVRVGGSWLPRTFVLTLEAGFANGHQVPFALVRGRRGRVSSEHAPELAPIAVTSLGRSGSTLLMSALAAHPQVVAYGAFPFAASPAGYWLHARRVLADPADRVRSAHPDTYRENLHWVGSNPFNDGAAAVDRAETVQRWFAAEYVDQLATFCQRSIDQYYVRLAGDRALSDVRYFVEKHEPGHIARTLSELYDDSREILLVRDFRDMACSMLAFGERGRVSYGRDRLESDEEFLVSLAPAVARLVAYRHERGDALHVLRYEELVAAPSQALAGVLEYLGLASKHELVEHLAEQATLDTAELRRHRTTSEAAASVGRYRSDLTPAALAVAEEAFGPGLEAFGYHRDGKALAPASVAGGR